MGKGFLLTLALLGLASSVQAETYYVTPAGHVVPASAYRQPAGYYTINGEYYYYQAPYYYKVAPPARTPKAEIGPAPERGVYKPVTPTLTADNKFY